jgi:hypothetical protein
MWALPGRQNSRGHHSASLALPRPTSTSTLSFPAYPRFSATRLTKMGNPTSGTPRGKVGVWCMPTIPCFPRLGGALDRDRGHEAKDVPPVISLNTKSHHVVMPNKARKPLPERAQGETFRPVLSKVCAVTARGVSRPSTGSARHEHKATSPPSCHAGGQRHPRLLGNGSTQHSGCLGSIGGERVDGTLLLVPYRRVSFITDARQEVICGSM